MREAALAGMGVALKVRKASKGHAKLDAAMKRIGELTLEIEPLRARCDANRPLP